MLRTFLLVVPFTFVAAFVVLIVMIPVTWIIRDIRPIYAAARWVVGTMLRLAGVRIEIRGPDPWSAPQPCIWVSNHVSNLDPPIVWVSLPRVAPIAKAAIFRWPLLGRALKLAKFIPVERGQADSRRKAMDAGIKRLREGISLLVYPEGTRSWDGRLLPFRPGPFTMAIETGVPIVPITILGAREVMPRGESAIHPGRVTLVVHDPIPTSGLTPRDRDELMRRTRAAIESALGDSSGATAGGDADL